LNNRGCDAAAAGFPPGNTDDAEYGQFGKGGARDKDTVCVGIKIGRSDLDAVIKQGEEVVWYDAFYGFAIAITKANPESVELGPAEEGLALGFKVAGEVTNEINRTILAREALVLAVGVRGGQWDQLGLPEGFR
jgi:hypothetical protein